MKTSCLIPLVTFLASSLPLFAAVDDILANTASFKPKVMVSDVYVEKILTEREDGETYRSVVASPQKIALSVTANLDGAITGTIDADTEVGVTAWNFYHSDTLGAASDYKPGAKKATFPYFMDVELANGDTKEVRAGSIVYAWTAKTLTVTLVITDVEGAGVSDIAASDYTAVAEPGEKVEIENEPIDVSVYFGEATGSRNVFLRGFAKVTTKSFGSEAADNYEEFDLTEVNLKGEADLIAPMVKATFAAKPDAEGKVSVSGTATDLQAVTLTAVTVGNVPAIGAAVTWSEPSEANVAAWSVTGIPLKKGANQVVLTFSDEDGNVAKVNKSYTVR